MPKHCMRVRIGKKVYSDVPTAAKARGVAVSTVYNAVRRGRVDHVGKGQGKGKRDSPSGPKVPVSLGPFKWPSLSAAGRDLGVSHEAVRRAVSPTAGPLVKARMLRRVMEYKARLDKESSCDPV